MKHAFYLKKKTTNLDLHRKCSYTLKSWIAKPKPSCRHLRLPTEPLCIFESVNKIVIKLMLSTKSQPWPQCPHLAYVGNYFKLAKRITFINAGVGFSYSSEFGKKNSKNVSLNCYNIFTRRFVASWKLTMGWRMASQGLPGPGISNNVWVIPCTVFDRLSNLLGIPDFR